MEVQGINSPRGNICCFHTDRAHEPPAGRGDSAQTHATHLVIKTSCRRRRAFRRPAPARRQLAHEVAGLAHVRLRTGLADVVWGHFFGTVSGNRPCRVRFSAARALHTVFDLTALDGPGPTFWYVKKAGLASNLCHLCRAKGTSKPPTTSPTTLTQISSATST